MNESADITLFANGDISLSGHSLGLFLLITSWGVEMGKVFVSDEGKHCQFTKDAMHVYAIPKQSAICALNSSELHKMALNNISIKTDKYSHTIKVSFDSDLSGAFQYLCR